MAGPDLSIVIANWNTRDLTLECIASIYESTHTVSFEIIVVDNGSTDDSVTAIAWRYPKVMIVANEANQGFARASNQGMLRASGRFVALLNSDTVVRDGAFDRLVGFMVTHPECGLVGPKVLSPQGDWVNRPRRFHIWWHDIIWLASYLSDLDLNGLLARVRPQRAGIGVR